MRYTRRMAAKRCPMCHLLNRPSAGQCDCGYTFGTDIADVRGMLANQIVTAWALAIGGLLLVLAGFASITLLNVLAIGPILAASGIMTRGIRMISRTRISQRQIAEKTRMPRAYLVE